MYAGQRKVAKEIEKKVKLTQGKKSTKSKDDAKMFYYHKLLNKNGTKISSNRNRAREK